MKDYEVIYENSLDSLEEVVNHYLSEGYLLAGGVVMYNRSANKEEDDIVYLQGVYKPE